MTTPPSTVPEVLDRLRAIDGDLRPDDGVAVFNRVYLTVTERVLDRLGADGPGSDGPGGGGSFRDPAFMAALDVAFARLWLSAYDASESRDRVPSAWAPLFEARSTSGLLPIQYALAGMNAHIEHDLPLAVVETCLARGATPHQRSVRADYESVNDILATVEAEIRRSFLTSLERQVDDEIGPVVHLVSSWNIDKARDLAWVNVEALWATRNLGPLHTRYVSALGHTVGMGSRLLLTPVAVRTR